LAFFTFHFGMFHFVHAVFLNGFFPLIEEGSAFPSLPALVARSAAAFWPLIVASFLSRLSDIFPGSPAPSGKDSFAAPYANVIRMHLLIFVFAGLHMADLSRFAILPVLAAYFFPWKAALGRMRGE
jgi:L-asparagine transporter-like permease